MSEIQGFGVSGSGFGFRDSELGFRVPGFGFGFRISTEGFEVRV